MFVLVHLVSSTLISSQITMNFGGIVLDLFSTVEETTKANSSPL